VKGLEYSNLLTKKWHFVLLLLRILFAYIVCDKSEIIFLHFIQTVELTWSWHVEKVYLVLSPIKLYN